MDRIYVTNVSVEKGEPTCSTQPKTPASLVLEI